MHWQAEALIRAGLDPGLLASLCPGLAGGSWATGAVSPLWAFPAMMVLMALPMGPAEPTAVAAGLIAGAPLMPLWAVVLALTVGMLCGDLVVFRAGGVVERCVRRRGGGGMIEVWQHRLDRHPRWRDIAVAGLRFVPGARTPAALAARSSGISSVRFCMLGAAGSLAWACLWTGAGSAILTILR